jgi:hypothetical protein
MPWQPAYASPVPPRIARNPVESPPRSGSDRDAEVAKPRLRADCLGLPPCYVTHRRPPDLFGPSDEAIQAHLHVDSQRYILRRGSDPPPP